MKVSTQALLFRFFMLPAGVLGSFIQIVWGDPYKLHEVLDGHIGVFGGVS